jgi:hypothetical protein
VVTGKVEAVASQMIGGSTVYYIQSEGKIYKVKATEDSTDQLPFIKVGDQFTGQLDKRITCNRLSSILNKKKWKFI